MKKFPFLRRMLVAFVMLLAVMNFFAAENISYRVRIEFVDYYDVQHTVWTSERLAEYCE